MILTAIGFFIVGYAGYDGLTDFLGPSRRSYRRTTYRRFIGGMVFILCLLYWLHLANVI
jgi:hypothetical protein